MRLYWVDTPAGRLATAPAPSGSGLDREVGDLVRDEVSIAVSYTHLTLPTTPYV